MATLDHELLQARESLYKSCLTRLCKRIVGTTLTLDFQYPRFDGSNRRMDKQLAKVLVAHIVTYCLNEKRIQEACSSPVSFAWQDARNLFTQRDDSGESGEILLYLLLEVVLQAPQVLAKMSLKTNPQMEVHGADGVHVKYNGPNQPLDVFLGESKIYKRVDKAIADALSSISEVRERGLNHEILLATEHFKWLKPEARDAIHTLLDPNAPSCNHRINFVVLIGFEFAPDGRTKIKESLETFTDRYTSRADSLTKLVKEKLAAAKNEHDDIVHIFFVPLLDAEGFRREFVKCLQGK